ncbi:MAG TPA: hypothetical protein VGM79_12735 [Streptosporangiaceae bacterium]
MIAAALIMMAAARPAPVLPRCTSTSACPAVLVNGTPYHRELKPAAIVLGAGRPELAGLKWRAYNHASAVATGWGEGALASCPPPYYTCPLVKRRVTVTFLHAVRGAAGNWFYSRMHVAGNVAGIEIKANWGVDSRGFWA